MRSARRRLDVANESVVDIGHWRSFPLGGLLPEQPDVSVLDGWRGFGPHERRAISGQKMIATTKPQSGIFLDKLAEYSASEGFEILGPRAICVGERLFLFHSEQITRCPSFRQVRTTLSCIKHHLGNRVNALIESGHGFVILQVT